MRLFGRLVLLLLPPAALAQNQDTSRTFTSAVCTNTALFDPLPTSAFIPILSIHLGTNEDCPQSAALNVHYHNENDVGCCTQSAVLTAPGGSPACCACGATCTGSVPAMVDWSFSGGQFITSAMSPVPTGPSSVPTSTTTSMTFDITTQSSFISTSPSSASTSPSRVSSTRLSTTLTQSPVSTAGAPPSVNIGFGAVVAGSIVGAFLALH